MSENKESNGRVIFADLATVKYNAVMSQLSKISVSSETVTDVENLVRKVSQERYDICVFNLLLGGVGPFELITQVRKSSLNQKVKIIVVTRQVHKLNIQNTMKAGADDFIAEPFDPMNLYNRIMYHLRPVMVIEAQRFENSLPGIEGGRYVKCLLEATELLSRTDRESMHGTLYKILQDVASLIESNRTSLIIVDEATSSGVVLATSDDANFHNFPISLEKYPEILHVMHAGNLIFIEDVAQNSLTDAIKKNVKSIAIGSMMVFPVRYNSEIVGVLVIRRPQATALPSQEAMRVLQATANLMAAHSNIAVLLRKIYKDYQKTAA